MPCRGDDNSYRSDPADQIAIDSLTRLLCSVMTVLSEKDIFRDILLETDCPNELHHWWQQHQEADARRLNMEKAEKKAAEDRAAALAKLTPHERALLGILY